MLDIRIESRWRRSWDFFLANAGALLMAALVVVVGSLLVVPAPWLMLNLLGEALDSMRAGRPVRWQGVYERKGTFLRSWGLLLSMGIPIVIGLALFVLPGLALALYWFHAPALAADGRPVLTALRESGERFRADHDWAAYFLNALVVALLWGLTGVTGLAVFATLPLVAVYLACCYLDARAPVPGTPPLPAVV